MPAEVDSKFSKFISGVGLRESIAQQLWDANIHTPQELAGREKSDLQTLVDDPLLVNHIHPVLQKNLYSISMADDPYQKAMKIMKKHAKSLDDDDEKMDCTSGLRSDGIQSDANPYATSTNNSSVQERTTRIEARPTVNDSASYNNNGTRLTTTTSTGNDFVQSHIGIGKNGVSHAQVNITGGTYVQSNILSSGPVTYNNTNTVISTTAVDQNGKDDVQRRRKTLLDSCFFIGDTLVNTAQMAWADRSDFWIDDIRMPSTDMDVFTRHMRSDDVYRVKNQGRSRALILNNINFDSGSNMTSRQGADIDCSRLETSLKKLGFSVQREKDTPAEAMIQILETFAKSQENIGADMTVVYIGSHGERDEQGNDMFVGSDGERVSFNKVKSIFSPSHAPFLTDLPKIFFLQFCRQEPRPTQPLNLAPAAPVQQTATVVGDSAPSSDATPTGYGPEPTREETRVMDMICAYATLAGNKAYRDTADGSWFVTALIRVFQNHAHEEDLLSMLTKVNNHVSINAGDEGLTRAVQISEVVHNLRKKLYFYPNLGA